MAETKVGDGIDKVEASNAPWTPRNWHKVPDHQLKKMTPQQRSRYLAYEQPPKAVAEATGKIKDRLRQIKKQTDTAESHEDLDEKEKHEKLIGHLKAAEARNRLRIMRLRYESNWGKEVYQLTMSQPNALRAVRLQALLPSKGEPALKADTLEKLQRSRVEKLVDDKDGLLTNRR